MPTPFENFVNTELPKRIGTNESPTTPQAGDLPVFTGVGLLTESKTPAELGLAVLVDGVVLANQLPSYVDDVLEFADLASFPVTGESGKVYVALDTNKTYRWSGSTYVQIGSDLALGETAATAYRGDKGKVAYDHSQVTGNPHGATTADITDSTDKRYVTDAQRTRVNTAASGTADGYLTSADWNTFNNKEQGGYIKVSSDFTAEVGKKYRIVRGLSSAITITPPVTTVDGAYFTVFYTYMTPTGSVTCSNPNISANHKDAWQEYEYTYDAAEGNWLPLRKSLGPIVPTGSSFQLVNPTNPDAKFTIQAPTSTGIYTLTMPNADVDLGNVADVRYVFLNDSTTTQTTYTVPASAVTAIGRTIIELSNNSLTSITINTATGTGKVAGDSVNINITGTYGNQVLVADGVTLQGDVNFSYQHKTKTLIYKGSNTWKVVG